MLKRRQTYLAASMNTEGQCRAETKLLFFNILRNCNCIQCNIWPVITFGKILGCFPFTINRKISQTNLCPFLFAYSLCMFLVTCYMSVYGIDVMFSTYKENELNDLIIKSFIISFRLLLFLAIPLSWINGSAFNNYFQEWSRFQYECSLCIERPFILNLKLPLLTLSIKCSIGVVACGVLQWFLGRKIHFFLTLTSVYMMSINSFNFIFFSLYCTACKLSFVILRQNLWRVLKRSDHLLATAVMKYRILYCRLHLIVSQTGDTFAVQMGLLLSYLFSGFVLSLFAWFVGVLETFDGMYIIYILASFTLLTITILTCNIADSVSNEVSKHLNCK